MRPFRKKLLVAAVGVAAVNYTACAKTIETGNRAYEGDHMSRGGNGEPLDAQGAPLVIDPPPPVDASSLRDASGAQDAGAAQDASGPRDAGTDAALAKKRDAGQMPMIRSGNLMAP